MFAFSSHGRCAGYVGDNRALAYGARQYHAPSGAWHNPDRLAGNYPHLSPYTYCAGDPVNCTDPSGCEIRGVTKEDAAMAVEDFRAMFPGDEFLNLRNLIVQSGKNQNGKSIAPISGEALSFAFSGITLNEDQQALVDMVVENLILRVMGIPYINTGANHVPNGEFSGCLMLPYFR